MQSPLVGLFGARLERTLQPSNPSVRTMRRYSPAPEPRTEESHEWTLYPSSPPTRRGLGGPRPF